MRWKIPKSGDKAVFCGFLWYPMTLISKETKGKNGYDHEQKREFEKRWLEFAYWECEWVVHPSNKKYFWKKRRWWSHAQAMRDAINNEA